MFPSRRTLLLSGAAAASVAALGIPMATLPVPAAGFQLFSEGEATLIAALGEAFFPPGNPLGVSANDLDIPLLVDALLANELDASLPPLFRYLLRAFDMGTLASRGSGFASLPLEDRRAVLDTWADNAILPRRLAYDGLKLVLGMAFFNAPEVTRTIGWFPRCHESKS